MTQSISKAKSPLVSIVIPTFNSAKTLELCLRSIMDQTYPHIEVLIVDNCSTDSTRQIAGRFGANFFKIKSGMAAARNIGVRKSRGQMIFSVDSDMRLQPRVVHECVMTCINGAADAVIVPEICVGENFWAKCRSLEKATYHRDPIIESARFFQRKVFDQVGGYDEGLLAGEDSDYHHRVRRQGFMISRTTSFIEHYENEPLSKLAMKKYRYGKTLRAYIRKRGSYALKVYFPVRLAWVRNYRALVGDPLHAAGMFFLKAVENLAALTGFVVSILP